LKIFLRKTLLFEILFVQFLVKNIFFIGNIMSDYPYKNEGLNQIAKVYPNIDFTEADKAGSVVPVGLICELFGLEVVFKKLSDGLAGYFDHDKKIIFVNDTYPATRNLFTIAHEIGHYILHNGTNNRYDEYHKYTPEERKREYEANEFAGKLLMPEQKFIKVFEEYKANVKKIADIFGVSIRACEVRAFNLGLIDSI
jgi:predicted transcriptional regulator